MIRWVTLATAEAPDGQPLVLRRRAHELHITAGGHDLMSSEDRGSSRALADLGCAHVGASDRARVLVGGLGMGFTLRAALDGVGARARVEIAELVPEVVAWNRDQLADLAGRPLDDPRVTIHVGDVGSRIRAANGAYDAILLDVDNGPDALAHPGNASLYGRRGVADAWRALRPGGALAVWSFSDDRAFTTRLERQGFAAEVHRVDGSRKGRGRRHVIWVARRPAPPAAAGRRPSGGARGGAARRTGGRPGAGRADR